MSKVVHVRCGTDIRDSLKIAGIEGDFVEWSDPVCQGPVPANLSSAELCETRAEFICRNYAAPEQYVEILLRLRNEQSILDKLDRYEKILLWFEHDWFDQSILLRLLNELSERPQLHQKTWILSIDRFPGIQRFIGLGQLRPEQLLSLLDNEMRVTSDAFRFARRAWRAFTDDEPLSFEAIMNESPLPDLPFLNQAMYRHLQEYPDISNGLALTYRLALEAIDAGAHSGVEVFLDLMSHREPQPFLGDSMFFSLLRDLIEAKVPAIREPQRDFQWIELSDFGRALLDGEANWMTENAEPDRENDAAAPTRLAPRWLGGVRVSASDFPWRWNESLRKLVRVPAT